jgi:hypothetical protein
MPNLFIMRNKNFFSIIRLQAATIEMEILRLSADWNVKRACRPKF